MATGDAVKKAMDELRTNLPPTWNCASSTPAATGSGLARRLTHTLVEARLLTVAIVFLFLHSWRSTIITGLTLPIAVISASSPSTMFGFTLNFSDDDGAVLCIGLLIDDAIVVRENIVRPWAWARTTTPRRARGHRGDRLAVMATTFAIVRGVRAGGLHGRHHRQVLLPFGITVVVAVLVSLFVSFTLDPMLSSVEGPAVTRLKNAAGHGPCHPRHRPRAGRPARGLQELIRWASAPAATGWLPPTCHDASRRRLRRERQPAPRWRRDAITPRGWSCWRGRAQLRGRARAGAAGGQRVRAADRPELHAAAARCRWARAWSAPTPRSKSVEDVAGDERGGDRFHLDRRPRPAQPGLAEHRASSPRQRSAARRRWKTRSATPSPGSRAPTPRWASTGRSTWPSWAATLTGWRACATSPKVKKIPGAVDVESSGQARAAGLRGAPEACAAVRDRPRPRRSSPAACAPTSNGEAGRRLLDHARRRPSRWCCG